MKKAFTLIELSVVILVLLALAGLGLKSSQWIGAWRLGKLASETLRSVHAAQRMYVADNPLALPATFTQANIDPYVIGGPPVAPLDLNGAALRIRYNFTRGGLPGAANPMVGQRIPVVTQGTSAAGRPYDPSTTTFDGLWDIGTL